MLYRKLRGRIKERYGTQAAFAYAMGLNPSTLSSKLRGKTDWTRGGIEKACELLDIDWKDIPDYFF